MAKNTKSGKGKKVEKKAAKKVKVPSIRSSILAYLDKHGLDGSTYKEAEAIALKINPDSAFKKTHFYFYRKIWKQMQPADVIAEINKKKEAVKAVKAAEKKTASKKVSKKAARKASKKKTKK